MADQPDEKNGSSNTLKPGNISPRTPLHNPSGEGLEENSSSPVPPIYDTDDTGEE